MSPYYLNRLYQTTGDSRCREVASLWFERTLKYKRTGEGAGGFLSWTFDDPALPPVWIAKPNFLDGTIGVALSLLSATCPTAGAWDRLLGISGRDQSDIISRG
jgi:hypothetical protein